MMKIYKTVKTIDIRTTDLSFTSLLNKKYDKQGDQFTGEQWEKTREKRGVSNTENKQTTIS